MREALERIMRDVKNILEKKKEPTSGWIGFTTAFIDDEVAFVGFDRLNDVMGSKWNGGRRKMTMSALSFDLSSNTPY